MANLMYTEMGMSLLKSVGSFAISREQAKLDEATRRYRQTMSALSAAQSENAITVNEAMTRDRAVFSRASIDVARMQEQADYAVEAAAAGISGNSVLAGLATREGDAARARTSMERDYTAQRQQYGQQRSQVNMDRIMSNDPTPIPRPNLGMLAFGIGSNMIDIHERHNPEDRRLSSRLARG